jgi:hypothetical protein
MHEKGLAVRIVLKHCVGAEITRGGTRGQGCSAHPSTGNSPPLAESEEGPSENILVTVREEEPLEARSATLSQA